MIGLYGSWHRNDYEGSFLKPLLVRGELHAAVLYLFVPHLICGVLSLSVLSDLFLIDIETNGGNLLGKRNRYGHSHIT